MVESLDDVYHVTRDDEYLRMAKEEAEFFDTPRFFSLDSELPVVQGYMNERFTGDEQVSWYETIANYGMFQRGCLLGTGGRKQNARILEQHPGLHLTVYDISPGSLAVVEREDGAKFPGRVGTQEADLNFAELPENAYDLIISSGCIHHLFNLEHIAYQINRSLTPEGYFFLTDYVGEARFQFTDERKQVFEAAFEEAKTRHPILRSWRVVWPDLSNWQYSPFESVRSDETLDIFRRYLTEASLHTACAVVGLLLFVQPAAIGTDGPPSAAAPRWRRFLVSLAGRLSRRGGGLAADYESVVAKLGTGLAPLDRELCDAGTLPPLNAFAVYRKRV